MKIGVDYCPNTASKEFQELKSIFGEAKAYLLWDKNHGNPLDLAPNGAESKLFQTFLDYYNGDRTKALIAKSKVYSENFLNWFGDWINNSEQASKVVDDNGEPFKSAIDNNSNLSTNNNDIYYNITKKNANGAIQILKEGGYIEKYRNFYIIKLVPNSISRVEKVLNDRKIGYFIKETKNKKGEVVRLLGIYPNVLSKDKIKAHEQKIISLAQSLANRFPGLSFQLVDEKDIPQNINKYATAWCQGGVVYLIRDRINEETVLEEFLHPFVTILQEYNPEYFRDLIKEIKKLYPDLIKEINENYNSDVFNQSDRDNEYVAQGLAKAMHERGHKNESVKDLIISFGKWFNELLRQFSIYIWRGFKRGGVYTIDPLKLKDLSVKELARLLNADDIEVDLLEYDDKSIRYHMSNPNRTMDEISTEIANQFKILYDTYRKTPNKTELQLRIQNQVFEKLTELRVQRDINSILIALETGLDIIGVVDINTGVPGNPNSVLGKLYDFRNSTVPYSAATANELVEMYRNSIGFFFSLLSDLPTDFYHLTSDLVLAAHLKTMRDDLYNRLSDAHSIWKNALIDVTDRIINEQIDAEVSLSQDIKDDMKVVYKDWLHENLYYGDISTLSSWLINYGLTNNPIIRLAFHMIQRAESKILFETEPIAVKITKQFKRAEKEHLLNPDWQTVLMEVDDEGKPTGKFVRDINYGQYEKDLNKFVDQLNEEFLAKYKFCYVLDDNDNLINSATGTLAEDEEWVGVSEPPYVEYMRRIEEFKCSRAFRRYTYNYYKERLSRPYSQSYPQGHGLSPKTLAKYNRIQSNINYYLDLCTDKVTGLHHPENLPTEDKKKLDLWKYELKKLSDVFDEDGWLKKDEDLLMAEEIPAWEAFISEKIVSQPDLDMFLAERQELVNRVNNGEITPQVLADFDKYNSSFGINLDFITQTIGLFDNVTGEPQTVVEARMRRRCIQDMVKTSFNKLDRDMSGIEHKKQIWAYLKLYDQAIDDGRITQGKDFSDEFDKNFEMKPVLYRDANGYAVDSSGNIVLPQDEDSHDDLLTYHEYIIREYTKEAETTGTIFGMVDLAGNPYTFSGTHDEIEEKVRELLTYTHRYTDSNGYLVEQQVPLSIFNVMYPKPDTFYNIRTKRKEKTIEYVPTGRFSTKADKWTNLSKRYIEDPANYNYASLQAELPKRQFYDNTELYKKATSGETGILYNMLIELMKDSQKDYNFGNPLFDYKLPQINATNAAILSRCLKNGPKSTLKYISDSIGTILENDDDMRSVKSGVVNPDGTFATDVPRRYINNLKDPDTITHNITGAVMMYMLAAKNYKYKTEIESELEALRYAMDLDNREKNAVNILHSREMYDSMMDKHVYGNQWGNRNLNELSKQQVITQKALKNAHRLEAVQMLGLNLISMFVGGADSITKMLRDAIAAKHFTVRSLINGIKSVLMHIPTMALNIGNPVANNKLTAVSLLFGIGRDFKAIYAHQDYGRIRKFATNFLMGGYSSIDYINNMILLRANLDGVRFYNGNKIKTGFYTKWELHLAFTQAGLPWYEATLAYMCCTKSLWGALKTKHGYAYIDPDYEKYINDKLMSDVRTRVLLRGALYNGMNPDNDIPRYKQNVLTAMVFAMRAWLLLQGLHLFMGLDDASVREFKEEEKKKKRGIYNKVVKERKLKRRTDEQRAKRLTWNFETGTPQDEIGNGLIRAFTTLMKKMYCAATLNKDRLKSVKFSHVEKYAVKDAIITLLLLHGMIMTWFPIHEWASSAYQYKPTNREEAGIEYQMQHFFDHDTYKMMIDDIYFRDIESQLSGVNPSTVSDIINSLSVLKSGVSEHMNLIKSAADVAGLSGHDLSEEIPRGKYKYFSRGERATYQFFGPLDNMYTAFSFQGLYNNELFYWNSYGGIIRSMYGYDFKQKLEEQSSNKYGVPNIPRPNIPRPNIPRPNIPRPNVNY